MIYYGAGGNNMRTCSRILVACIAFLASEQLGGQAKELKAGYYIQFAESGGPVFQNHRLLGDPKQVGRQDDGTYLMAMLEKDLLDV
jgi:hypothetical protein